MSLDLIFLNTKKCQLSYKVFDFISTKLSKLIEIKKMPHLTCNNMSHVEKANEMDHSKAIRGYLGIFNLV